MDQEKWVTFDCFGTLVDWQAGFHRILEGFAGHRTGELVRAYHEAEVATEGDDPSRSYKDVLRLTLRKAADAISLSLSTEQSESLVRDWGTLPVFADTAPALSALKADGWRLGILTNCDDDLFAKTRAVFPVELDHVVTAQQVGSYKPDLAHFERFERDTGVARSRWVHAAVAWWHDIKPAQEFGLTRIWVDRENSGHDAAIATARIPDLTALPATLRALPIS